MRNFVSREYNMWLVEELLPDEVAQRVVLFVYGKRSCIWDLGVGGRSYLLLISVQEEVLKRVGSIHGCGNMRSLFIILPIIIPVIAELFMSHVVDWIILILFLDSENWSDDFIHSGPDILEDIWTAPQGTASPIFHTQGGTGMDHAPGPRMEAVGFLDKSNGEKQVSGLG